MLLDEFGCSLEEVDKVCVSLCVTTWVTVGTCDVYLVLLHAIRASACALAYNTRRQK